MFVRGTRSLRLAERLRVATNGKSHQVWFSPAFLGRVARIPVLGPSPEARTLPRSPHPHHQLASDPSRMSTVAVPRRDVFDFQFKLLLIGDSGEQRHRAQSPFLATNASCMVCVTSWCVMRNWQASARRASCCGWWITSSRRRLSRQLVSISRSGRSPLRVTSASSCRCVPGGFRTISVTSETHCRRRTTGPRPVWFGFTDENESVKSCISRISCVNERGSAATVVPSMRRLFYCN